MNKMACRTALVAALLVVSGGANAQVGRNYDVKPMNFDLWCQQTAHIAPDRCDKRLPEDDDADIMHNDPTDRSSTRAVQTQGQQTSQTPVRTDASP